MANNDQKLAQTLSAILPGWMGFLKGEHLCLTLAASEYYPGELVTWERSLSHLGRNGGWGGSYAHPGDGEDTRDYCGARQRRPSPSKPSLPAGHAPSLPWGKLPGCCGSREPGKRLNTCKPTLPPGRVLLGRRLCPTASGLHWSNQVASQLCGSVRRQTGGLPGDGQTPETDRFPAYGQSPWRQALTRWPRSCPCPSPRSSGRGQPSLQAAPRHSNNNPPGS